MGNPAELANDAAAGLAPTAVLPPTSPFLALNAHFGMLLGVPELELLSAYPRGKTRLHNSWLHGFGVVWGYAARVGPQDADDETPPQELRVEPGLALAKAGQELYLERAACLDLGAWYAKHKDDADLAAVVTEVDGVVSFDAHVTLAPRACLTRPVPAITQPCSENASGTAFSRVSEQVQLELLPGLAPALEPPPLPYHRLRVLFALADAVVPDDDDVVAARDAVLALPSDQQPAAYLEAFRRFAALDTADLAPFVDAAGARALFPARDDATLVLANVTGVHLREQDDGTFLLEDPPPVADITVRPSLVATSTIQELLCGPLFAAVAAKRGPEPAPSKSRAARAARNARRGGKSDSKKRS